MPAKYTPPVVLHCIVCGNEFRTKPSRATTSKYCSMTCLGIDRKGRTRRTPETENTTGGYIYVYRPEHPGCHSTGLIALHRLIAEGILGRYLLPTEIVHHLNGIKDDNRPENLEVMTQADHARLHKISGEAKPIRLLRGVEHHRAKLTDDVVREIRAAAACGTSRVALARRYGVSASTISHIVLRKGWRHVA